MNPLAPTSPPSLSTELAARRAALWQHRLDLEARYDFRGKDEHFHFSRRARIELGLVKVGLHAVGMWNRGRRNARQPQLRNESRHVAGLAGLAGLRILHLSDLHLSIAYPGIFDATLEALDGVEADIALVSGDYRFGHYGPIDHIAPGVARLLNGLSLRYGAFGVLGNHDVSTLVAPLQKVGLQVLVNEGCLVQTHLGPLWVGGVDDPHIFHAASVACALEGAPDGVPRILIAHSPEITDEAAAEGIDLYVCGHTHAGQLCLPLWGAVKMNARAPRELIRGWWRVRTMDGHTSPGLGTTDLPVRYHCPPEATRITLSAQP